METDNLRFKNTAIARAYISNLADNFEYPEEMEEFLKACAITQAALARWLFEANRYDRILQCHYKRGVHTERKSKVELGVAWNEYSQASIEFEQAKENLNRIISKLDMAHGYLAGGWQEMISKTSCREVTHADSA